MLNNGSVIESSSLKETTSTVLNATVGTLYLALHTYNTLSFFIDNLSGSNLGQLALLGALNKKINEVSDINLEKELEIARLLDKSHNKTLEEVSQMKAKFMELDKQFTEIFNLQYAKLEKGSKALESPDALEESFLILPKLNTGALDRFFSQQMINDKNEDAKNIVFIKDLILAGGLSGVGFVKLNTYLLGGYLRELGDEKLKSFSPENQERLQNSINYIRENIEYLSPAIYFSKQLYSVTNSVIKTSLIPANLSVVGLSGFLKGASDVILNEKNPEFIELYKASQAQSWGSLCMNAVSGTTMLAGNVLSDLKKSYDFALMKQTKILDIVKNKGIEAVIENKPLSKNIDLAALKVLEGLSDKHMGYEKPLISYGQKASAAFKAITGVGAKYTFKVAEQAGQLTGSVVQQITGL